MPDISMCPGGDCPLKESCHRFTAKPSDYQTYFVDPPYIDDGCDMFWGNKSEQIYLNLWDIVNGNINKK
jgi:hypothetical protein